MPAQSVTLFVVAASRAPANQPPVASATATPTSGVAPLAVSFNGSGSSDPDGSIVSCAWTFGDGGTGTGPTPSHTYQNASPYTANLTMTDNQSATGSTSLTISVKSIFAMCVVRTFRSAGPAGLHYTVAENAVELHENTRPRK